MSVYRAKYVSWHLPPQMEPGQETICRVRIQNKSRESWYPSPQNGSAPVVASYHWFDHRGRCVVYDGIRTSVPQETPPGGTAEIDLRVRFPQRKERYILEVSLLQEGVAWFHDKGVEPLRLELTPTADGAYVARRLPPRWVLNLKVLFAAPFLAFYRERNLIWNMARRDMIGRYKGTLGGPFWAVFNPLLMIAVYTFLFAFILKVRFGQEGKLTDFAFYFICGLLPWMAFSDPVQRSQSVIADNSNLVKRVVFPVEILPLNLVLSALLTSLIAWAIFLLGLFLFGYPLQITLLALPFLMVFQVAFTVGLSWFLASLGVFVRDVGQILGVGLTMWFFLTPIVYPESAVGPTIRSLYNINPFFHIVKAYRALVLEGTVPSLVTVVAIVAFGTVTFFLGYAWFRKTQKAFADVL